MSCKPDEMLDKATAYAVVAISKETAEEENPSTDPFFFLRGARSSTYASFAGGETYLTDLPKSEH